MPNPELAEAIRGAASSLGIVVPDVSHAEAIEQVLIELGKYPVRLSPYTNTWTNRPPETIRAVGLRSIADLKLEEDTTWSAVQFLNASGPGFKSIQSDLEFFLIQHQPSRVNTAYHFRLWPVSRVLVGKAHQDVRGVEVNEVYKIQTKKIPDQNPVIIAETVIYQNKPSLRYS